MFELSVTPLFKRAKNGQQNVKQNKEKIKTSYKNDVKVPYEKRKGLKEVKEALERV